MIKLSDGIVIHNLDDFLSLEHIFCRDYEEMKTVRNYFIVEQAKKLMGNNQHYKQYCEQKNVNIALIEKNVDYVPKLPSSIFKKHINYVSTTDMKNNYITTSSGTQGTISRIPRDSTTLMHLYASVLAGMDEVLEVPIRDLNLMFLSPPNNQAKNLWIAYVLSGVSLHYDSSYYVDNGKFRIETLISDLHALNFDERFTIVVGPPALIMETVRAMDKTKRLNLGNRCLVLSAGGWKRKTGEIIKSTEFREVVTSAFGLQDEGQVRDIFNMVELNSVIFECNHHMKHCPPWLYAKAFNPRTLEICPSGEFGILGYLDPTAQSFPGFILSDDFGRVYEKVRCECGITSDVIHIERRINKLESRGCALKI